HHESGFAVNHVFGQTSCIRTHNWQCHGLRFQHSVTESLGNGRMKEDIGCEHFLAHLRAGKAAQKLHAILHTQLVSSKSQAFKQDPVADDAQVTSDTLLVEEADSVDGIFVTFFPSETPD